MAEDSFKTWVIGFMLVTLFATLIITAVNYQGAMYNKDTTQVTGGSLDVTRFNSSLNDMSEDAETFRERFEKQNIFVALGELVISGIFDIAIDIIQSIMTPFTLISDILYNVFHAPAYVINTVKAILIISLIFAIWRLIKIGD